MPIKSSNLLRIGESIFKNDVAVLVTLLSKLGLLRNNVMINHKFMMSIYTTIYNCKSFFTFYYKSLQFTPCTPSSQKTSLPLLHSFVPRI